MNWRMYVAFVKWVFMRTFRSFFTLAKEFRHELKRGGDRTPMAIFAFIGVSLIAFLFYFGIALWFTNTKDQLLIWIQSYASVVVVTFVYNVVKVMFECFLEERQHVFDELKK